MIPAKRHDQRRVPIRHLYNRLIHSPLCLFLIIFFSLSQLSGEVLPVNREVKVAVQAYEGIDNARLKWQPTLDYLSQKIDGYQFSMVPLRNLKALVKAVSRNEVDFVICNPSSHVNLAHEYGIRRIATLKNTRFDGGFDRFGSVIFTRADRDDIQVFEDLLGMAFMGVSENTIGGWQAALWELRQREIYPYRDFRKVLFAKNGSQSSVVQAVLRGDVDAGNVRTGVLEKMVLNGKLQDDDIKIIEKIQDDFPLAHSTKLYPEWPLSVQKDIPDELVKMTLDVLFNISPDEPAAVIGDYSGWTFPQDYFPVNHILKDLKLAPYKHIHLNNISYFFSQNRPWIVLFFVFLSILTGFGIYYYIFYRKIRNAQDKLTKYKISLETEIKNRTESLVVEEQKLRTILDNSLDPIVGVDKDRNIIFWNHKAQEVFGYSSNEILGQSISILVPDERLGEVDEILKRVSKHKYIDKYETVRIAKNGDRIPVEITVSAIFTQDEQISGFTAVLHDLREEKRSSDMIYKTTSRFRHMVENTSDWIWEVDNEGIFTYSNPKVKEILGYHHSELIGNKIPFEFMTNGDSERVKRFFFENLLKNRIPFYELITRVKHREGHIVILETNGVPVLDEKGEIKGYRGISRDVTEREMITKDLREKEEIYKNLYSLLRTISDNMTDMLWAKDLEKNYIFANKAICEKLLIARDTDEPLGKNDMFFAERERKRHPENPDWHTFGEICRDSDQVIIDTEKPRQFDEFGNVQGRFLYLDVHKSPLFNTQGKMIGVVGSARDVTAEKEILRKLEESEEKYRQTMDAALVGIYIIQDLKFKYVNREMARLFGYSSKYMVCNINPLDLIIPEHRELVKEILIQRQDGKTSDPYEVKCIRKDGTVFEALAWGQGLTYESKPASVGTLLNISEQKHAERQLKEYRNELEEMVKKRTSELVEKNAQLERFNRLFIDREFRIKELKDRVKELESNTGDQTKGGA